MLNLFRNKSLEPISFAKKYGNNLTCEKHVGSLFLRANHHLTFAHPRQVISNEKAQDLKTEAVVVDSNY